MNLGDLYCFNIYSTSKVVISNNQLCIIIPRLMTPFFFYFTFEWMNERRFSDTDLTVVLSLLSPSPTPSIPPVFLHVRVVDIDQLKLIMMLVGTPGPELLMKISSESVSVKYHPTRLCCTAPPACVCVASVLPWQELDSQLYHFVLLLLFLNSTCLHWNGVFS